jgi:ATP-binding cassette subfamily B protein
MTTQPDQQLGFWAEVRLILSRAVQVWRLVPRRQKLGLSGSAVLMAVTSGCATLIALLMGRLADGVKDGFEQHLSRPELVEIACFFLALLAGTYLLREGLHVLRRLFAENACTAVERDLTVRLIDHLMKVDLATLNEEKVGALHGRIQRSVVGCVRFLRLGVLEFLPALTTGALALAAAVSKQPILGLIMLGVAPVSIYLTVRQLVTQKGVRIGLNTSREVMDGTVVELLHGLDFVRAANTQGLELRRVADAAEARRRKEARHHFEMTLYGCAKALNEAFFYILVLCLAVNFYIQGSIQFGDIWAFSLLFLNVMTPLAEVHRVLDDGHECSIQVGILLDLLAEPVDRSFAPADHQEPTLDDVAPALAVEDLHLAYTTANGKKRAALNGVTLAVRHGETVGVAGRSGSGKTTWLKVLLRLAHPTRGRVLIGGVPVDAVSREAIGRLVGYVGQQPFIVAGTIADNICYGCEGATEEEVRWAATRACLHDEIEAMPHGYQTRVTERGTNLSGGQRQRVALARVFLKNPPVLVLDEGTSALDTISERVVQRAIDAARADRTVILVAHRLSTLRAADRIVVFDQGRIAEQGTYAELLQTGGVFADLARHAEEIEVPVKAVEPAVKAHVREPAVL